MIAERGADFGYMKLTKTQSTHIQLLRGLAIAAVVLIHNTPSGMAQVAIRPFLNFSVGMFLFLSGMLSCKDTWNPKKRIIKVLIPYGVWTLIYVCAYNTQSISSIPVRYIKSLIVADGAAIMYYIFVYCQFTILIPIIDRLAKSKYKYVGFVIAPVEILVMRSLPLIMGYQYNAYLQIVVNVSCLGWFTYFYLGYLLANGHLTVKCRNTTLTICLALSILLQIGESYWYYSLGTANCGSQMKITAVLTGVFCVLLAYRFICSAKAYTCKILLMLGDYAFGIYFSHLLIMFVLRFIPYYEKYVIYPVNAAVAIAISLSLCVLMKKALKKHSWFMGL